MVLPTYLGIKEAAKRIEQKCREPVTTDWLLQHASEGRLQLFALVRDEDVCILTGAKPFGTGRMNTPERAPMSVMSHEVFGGDRFPLDALDQMIRVVHPVGSRAPLEDVWASRLVANRNADIYTVAIGGERASIISRIYSNWRLHENGHIVGSAWRWKVSISDLCFLSENIEQLIEANSSIAATSPKQPAAPTKTTATETKVGAGDTASMGEAVERGDGAPAKVRIDKSATKGVKPEQTKSSDIESEAKKPKRINENRAFLMACIDEGIDRNIESIWLHIRQNAGKEHFLFASAAASTATTIDGKKVQKKNLARTLKGLPPFPKYKQ